VACPEDRNLRSLALLTAFFGLDLIDVAAGADLGSGEGPAQLLLHFAALARAGNIPALFASIVDDSGIVRRQVFADGSERALTNTLHVLEILQAEWMRTRASLLELADTLDAFMRGTRRPPGYDSDLQRLETDKDAVQILTVHKAKGLEAGVVFLYGGTGEKRGKTIHTLREHGRRVVHIGPLAAAEKQRVAEENEDENSRLLYVAMTRARYRLYLPHYPPQLRSLSGRYGGVNRRLDEILGQQHERRHPLFAVIPVDDSPHDDSPHAWPATKADAAPDLVPIALSSELLAGVIAPAEIAAIKQRRRGFLVTSYTAIKRAHGGFVPVEDHTDFPLAVASEPAGDLAVAEAALNDDLPGGPETGVFLHELLENMSLSDLARAPSFADWFSQPSVAELLEKLRRRHGRPEHHGPLAARLVYGAYTTPVRLGHAVIARLASVKQARREMEFLFPMPEQAHPLLSRSAGGSDPVPWRVERGLVKGFVDLLFEHEGKVYVCDWKSDHLPSWDAETVARHCAQNYDIQARVYTMAVLRLCGIATRDDCERRFGGVLFLFLRGRRANDDSAGIFFRKPAWDEILAWEADMLGQDFWGLT
jgi:exodeoxyribonuclease V beta subunit